MSEAKKHRILLAARSVFLRYGFRRVNMHDLAEAARVSRPALYVLFKNKEEIFIGVFRQWVDETIADVERAMTSGAAPADRLERAFEIWALRPFEMAMASPEAQELIECGYGFAQTALREGCARFEATIAPVLAMLPPSEARITPERTAHVLASAVRGFKLTATSVDELRRLIKELLLLSLSPALIVRPDAE